jgi:MFS family permease
MASFLSHERIEAVPGFNRWLVPPAALAIHLCIGQAYAFSVFNLPLSRVLGVTAPTQGDWSIPEIGWVFTLAIVVLGLSAAFGGKWVQRVGPRLSGVVSAVCWGSGFLIGAAGVHFHNIWLLYVGYGVIGGCGLGLGYITPVSTLIKWFPDRRGMATGMAIMGFGGGALIAAPLSTLLMGKFAGPESVGVAETFLVLGGLYLAVMLGGALGFRVPPPGWTPAGWAPLPESAATSRGGMTPDEAIRTVPFYLLWGVLFLNVSAGIGVLGQASAMAQEMFPGRISPEEAAGFVGLLGLFNLAGRFVWSSASDFLGRKSTYTMFFLLGTILYAAIPWTGRAGNVVLFVAFFAVIMSMYGGGFATIPAYLADTFGTLAVGAIHGRLLTAWSAAGIAGPALVNYMREYQIRNGTAKAEAYSMSMNIVAGMLLLGLLCNLFIVRAFMGTPEKATGPLSTPQSAERLGVQSVAAVGGVALAILLVAWAVVLLPLGWGVASTFAKAAALFD